MNEEAHSALYSRFHLRAHLKHVDEEGIKAIFRHILAEFVSGNSEEDWCIWQERFVASDLGQPPGAGVSIRMLQQFLMAQITNARVAKLGTLSHEAGAPQGRRSNAGSPAHSEKTFRISQTRKADFLSLICRNCTTHSKTETSEGVVEASG